MNILSFLCTLISAALGFLLPVPNLPTPPQFQVGLTETEWEWDWHKPEKLTKILFSPLRKKMTVKLLYPVDKGLKGFAKKKWLTTELSSQVMKIGLHPKIPAWFFSHLSLTDLPCHLDAPISTSREKWPLIILSHGLKGIPDVYMTIATELASRGFVVCSILHTDGSSAVSYEHFAIDDFTARNEQVRIRADNVSFAIDKLTSGAPTVLKDKLDFSRIAVIGHSFGGATVVKAVKEDARISCGVGLDPWLYPLSEEDKTKDTKTPLLFVGSHEYIFFGVRSLFIPVGGSMWKILRGW